MCLAGLGGFPSEVLMAPALKIGGSTSGAAEPLPVISDHSTAEKHQEARAARLLCWYFYSKKAQTNGLGIHHFCHQIAGRIQKQIIKRTACERLENKLCLVCYAHILPT